MSLRMLGQTAWRLLGNGAGFTPQLGRAILQFCINGDSDKGNAPRRRRTQNAALDALAPRIVRHGCQNMVRILDGWPTGAVRAHGCDPASVRLRYRDGGGV